MEIPSLRLGKSNAEDVLSTTYIAQISLYTERCHSLLDCAMDLKLISSVTREFVTEEETANRRCSFEMIAGSDVIFKFVHIAAAVAVPYFVW